MSNNLLKESLIFCLIILGILVVLAIFFIIIGAIGLAIIMIAVIAFLIRNWVFELKEPYYALVFKMGRPVGKIGPGRWHLVDGFFNKTKVFNMGLRRVDLPECTMYKKDGTKIQIKKVSIFFKITDLIKVISMEEEPKERIISVSMAKLKASIGKRGFTGNNNALVNEHGQIETELKDKLKSEMEDYGCEITDMEIADYDEVIHSEAAATKVKGEADAFAQGKKAKAISEPLKDNMPAAIASVGSSLADSMAKMSKKKRKEN